MGAQGPKAVVARSSLFLCVGWWASNTSLPTWPSFHCGAASATPVWSGSARRKRTPSPPATGRSRSTYDLVMLTDKAESCGEEWFLAVLYSCTRMLTGPASMLPYPRGYASAAARGSPSRASSSRRKSSFRGRPRNESSSPSRSARYGLRTSATRQRRLASRVSRGSDGAGRTRHAPDSTRSAPEVVMMSGSETRASTTAGGSGRMYCRATSVPCPRRPRVACSPSARSERCAEGRPGPVPTLACR